MDNVCTINLQFAQRPGSLRTGSVSKACIRGALNISRVSDTISARSLGFPAAIVLLFLPLLM